MEPIHPSLTGVPPEILNKICKFLDYKQITGLRPVCRRLNNYVDNFRPDFGLKFIGIRVMKDNCELFFGESSEKDKIIKHIDGEEHRWKPLETLLAHQKSPLSGFSMYSIKNDQEGYSELLETTETCLRARVSRLEVKECHIGARNENDVMKILPYLDPRFLRIMQLYFYNHSVILIPSNRTGTLERVKQLEHWKSLNELEARLFWIEDANLEDFEHMERFTITMKTLKMSDVATLKEKILTSAIKTNNVVINHRDLIKDVEIPPGHLPVHNPNIYRYPMPNRENQLLLLMFYTNSLRIRIIFFPRRGRRRLE